MTFELFLPSLASSAHHKGAELQMAPSDLCSYYCFDHCTAATSRESSPRRKCRTLGSLRGNSNAPASIHMLQAICKLTSFANGPIRLLTA